MAFWRRARGRHALGSAVTALPVEAAAPVAVPAAPVAPAAAVAPVDPPPPPVVPPALDWTFPEVTPPDAAPRGPRVELTFRDGTSTALDAVQARALDEIAQVLTRRD